MPMMPPTFRPHGVRSKVERDQAHDQRRGSAHSRGYDGRWSKASKGRLSRSPLCRYCEVGAFGQPPCTTAASLVDHLYPHQGDTVLFWTTRLWVSSCDACHSGPKQAAERRGRAALDHLADLIGVERLGG